MLSSILGPGGRETATKPSADAQPADPYFSDGAEPALGEIIDDPMVRSLMASDGVQVEALMAIIETARRKLQ